MIGLVDVVIPCHQASIPANISRAYTSDILCRGRIHKANVRSSHEVFELLHLLSEGRLAVTNYLAHLKLLLEGCAILRFGEVTRFEGSPDWGGKV